MSAHEIIKAGFPVIPLHSDSKKAAIDAWQMPENWITDPEDWEDWRGCNVGIPTGRHLIVVDIDNKDGKPASEKLEELREKYPELEKAPLVQTPSGGLHLYLKAPHDGEYRSGVSVLGSGIDIRADRGYVGAPGSTFHGAAYHWIGGIPQANELPEASETLITAINARARLYEQQVAPEALEHVDSAETLAWAKSYLMFDAPPAIEGHGGNNQTFRVFARLRDVGVSEAQRLLLVADHYNERCSPPWEFEELDRLNKNVEEYAQGALGGAVTRHGFEALEDDDVPAETEGKAPVTAAVSIDWAAWHGKPIPKREWLWEGYVPRGVVTLLTGDGGIGKTLLAQQLATSVALSAPLMRGSLGQVQGGKVVALLAEDEEHEIVRRQKAILDSQFAKMTDVAGKLHIIPPSEDLDHVFATYDRNGDARTTEVWERFCLKCAEVRPDLIVVDNIAEVYGGDEIVRLQVRQFIAGLTMLARQHDAAVVLIGHPSRQGMRDGSGYSGSTAWHNSVRSRLYLTWDDDSGERVLRREKSNYGAVDGQGEGVEMFWIAGTLQPRAVAEARGLVVSEAEAIRVILTELDRLDDDNRRTAPQSNGYAPKALLARSAAVVALGLDEKGVAERLRAAMLDGHIVAVKMTDKWRRQTEVYRVTELGQKCIFGL